MHCNRLQPRRTISERQSQRIYKPAAKINILDSLPNLKGTLTVADSEMQEVCVTPYFEISGGDQFSFSWPEMMAMQV